MEEYNLMSDLAMSTFRIFGFGFLGGSLFSILILLIFDWMKSREPDDRD